MLDHFSARPNGGVHIGQGRASDLTPEAADYIRRVRGAYGDTPRGWNSSGRTWDDVPGTYLATHRQVLVGDTGAHSHGSLSMAVHEFTHAVDDMLGDFSGSERWRDVSGYAVGAARHPYFNFKTNPQGFWSEAFAEGMTAWAHARERGTDPEEAIADAFDIGSGHRAHELIRKSLRDMVALFEELSQ